MFDTVRNAFKVKDIRDRIIFTFLMLIVIRIGSQLPIPGVDRNVFASWFASQGNDAFNFFDAVTGGSFTQMSVFALNITPYITSSIIMQLLTIAIPKLEEMQRDGEEGRKKIAEITRYLTVALALIEAIAMSIGFYRGNYLDEKSILSVIQVVLTLTAGSAVLMWIGERITEKGVGNGISIVLVINIVSRIPQDFASLYEQFVAGKIPAKAVLAAVIILAIVIAMVVFVVLLQGAERKIPVQYSKKIQGRKQVGGQSSHIPLKVNTGGVIPVIFAQSLMMAPLQIASFFPAKDWMTTMNSWLGMKTWYSLTIYVVLIILFTFFYTKMQINPEKVAENLGKSGAYIPSVRPGKQTEDYINKVLSRITVLGALCLAVIAVLPHLMPLVWPEMPGSMAIGGTGMIIVVGVALETVRQVQGLITQKSYKNYFEE